jgi:SAM-dependent methyltransferase
MLRKANEDKTNYWEEKYSNRPHEPATRFAKRAYKLMKANNHKTLLDLGCGSGRDSIYFFNRGLKVTALDSSQIGINKLRSQNEKINSLLEDIRNIKFKENSFDVIYAHLSLHYFDDETTKRIFDNLYRNLKRGGFIFARCKSTEDSLFGQGKKIGENMYKKEHVRHFFTKEYMAEKLREFKIVKISKISFSRGGNKSSFIDAVATK